MPFLFVTCQNGAETPLKAELARRHPAFRFAYSRPGFVTFKVPEDVRRERHFELRSVFARAWGMSLDKVSGNDGHQLAADFWTALTERFPPDDLAQFTHLHVWERDRQLPGDDGFEPGISPLADEIACLIEDACPLATTPAVNALAAADDRVLDCVIVEPGELWIGTHRVQSPASAWPGGVYEFDVPDNSISRTWLKMEEALRWSGLPVQSGDSCVEIGSAPGGASQALLKRGLRVTGIDPADMDEALRNHPYFRHIRARAKDLKRGTFSGFKWLTVDASVAPKYTLDTVEAIVRHENVRIEGMLLTLKLSDWKIADHIPDFHKRIRSWGYANVRSRQLAFNRREICVAATDLQQPPAD
jgi:23S rRNA (cytidine2498-2'-O)-methyltransferase